jgi:hypothetical protein
VGRRFEHVAGGLPLRSHPREFWNQIASRGTGARERWNNQRVHARRGSTGGCEHRRGTEKDSLAARNGAFLADVAALEAPWFLDRNHADKYQAAVFANNALLANALANEKTIFETVAHPILDCGCGVAPFCVLSLKDKSRQANARLEQSIKEYSRRRQILFEQGGSFGFRGHRFEVMQPDDETAPFLRVAIGRRAGWSLDGIIALFRNLS